VIDDIFWVAERTEQDPLVLASVVYRESKGHREATNFCIRWGEPYLREEDGRWFKPCLQYNSCYVGCRKNPYIIKNQLDVGVWQLRNVVELKPDGKYAGWSWVRSYRIKTGAKAGPHCAYERECSRNAMVFAVNDLRTTAEEVARVASLRKPTARQKKYLANMAHYRCKGVPDELRWLGGWNKCKSALNHTKVSSQLVAQRDALLTEPAKVDHEKDSAQGREDRVF